MEKEIKSAHAVAHMAHLGQTRKFTGEPYIIHPQETLEILWEITNGERPFEEYQAALLHDVVEDTAVTMNDVEHDFGEKVGNLVFELTTDKKSKELKAVHLARKMSAMTESALDIKLCDRLSNIIGLEDTRIPNSFVKRYVLETHFILKNLERELTSIQKELAQRINNMLVFLKINRNF